VEFDTGRLYQTSLLGDLCCVVKFFPGIEMYSEGRCDRRTARKPLEVLFALLADTRGSLALHFQIGSCLIRSIDFTVRTAHRTYAFNQAHNRRVSAGACFRSS
jgi:hypothetical protein